MIPEIGQTFTATIPAKAHALTKCEPFTLIGWHEAVTHTYTLAERSIVDNDTDREFKLIRNDGAITEVETKWFSQRVINILN